MKFSKVGLLAFFAFFLTGVFAPYGHLLSDAHHLCFGKEKAGLAEFCGGAAHPCSQKEHDHASKKHSHHCVVCQATQTNFFAEKLQLVFDFSLRVLDQLFLQEPIFCSAFFSSQLGSRAPPVNSY